jgi:hypothetical protein
MASGHPTGPWTTPRAQAAPGTPAGLTGAFSRVEAPRVADSASSLPATFRTLLSHFAHDGSPAVRTRICCVVAAGPTTAAPAALVVPGPVPWLTTATYRDPLDPQGSQRSNASRATGTTTSGPLDINGRRWMRRARGRSGPYPLSHPLSHLRTKQVSSTRSDTGSRMQRELRASAKNCTTHSPTTLVPRWDGIK